MKEWWKDVANARRPQLHTLSQKGSALEAISGSSRGAIFFIAFQKSVTCLREDSCAQPVICARVRAGQSRRGRNIYGTRPLVHSGSRVRRFGHGGGNGTAPQPGMVSLETWPPDL